MSIAPGSRLGRYEILSQIGAGGMGEVYLARDTTELERAVAIKVLPPEMAEDPERMRRFVQEAKTASSLNHPNILTIHEIGQADGTTTRFIATEYVEGETLRRHMVRSCLTLREALDVAIQIGYALVAAHKAGVVHRDIKPENVMLREDGIVKVLDFGLAKLSGRPAGQPADDSEAATRALVNTGPGIILGTVSYMSPEQARGQVVDARTDIWSLGCVLFEMVAGRVPFEGATASDYIAKILERDPPPLARYSPGVPDRLEEIVTKTLAKDREERYQTVKDLVLDLKRLRQRLETEAEIERSVSLEMDEGAVANASSSSSRAAAASRVSVEYKAHTAEMAGARPTTSAEYVVTEIKRHQKGSVLALIGVISLTALSLLLWRQATRQTPKVSRSTQVTRDDRQKSSFVTDGNRIYFTAYESMASVNYLVSASGGETVRLPKTNINAAIVDISPDGTELLMNERVTASGEFPLWVQPVIGGSPRRVGNLVARDAAWSPDRQEIAYGSGPDLMVAKADGSEPRKLASVEGRPWRPRWSPDGRRVRFTVLSSKDGSNSLWEVGADATGLRPLLPGWNTPAAECCGTWTADGRYFFFQSRRNSSTDIWAIDEAGGWLQRGNVEPVRLTLGPLDFTQPVPGKDGKKLFAVGELRRGEVVRYDAKSGEFVPFIQGLSAQWVDFSRDGEWMTYIAYPDGTLWRSRVDGTERLQLTSSPMRAALPRWSPDGRRIVFNAFIPGQPRRIYLISAEGGAPQQPMPERQNVMDATWSPSGDQLVFGTTGPVEHPAQKGIYIYDLSTNRELKLPGSEEMLSPRWSPDGRYISAITLDLQKLLLFDRTTERWAELAKMVSLGYPHWSRDAEYIYFYGRVGEESTVVRIGVRERKVEQVTTLKGIKQVSGEFGHWGGFTPENLPLVLRDTGTQEIYALDLQLP